MRCYLDWHEERVTSVTEYCFLFGGTVATGIL